MIQTFKENYMEQQQRHPHAELIHLWAEGAEIEMLVTSSIWANITSPSWISVTNPFWNSDSIYRVKPKLVEKTLWVQVWDTSGDVKQSKYSDPFRALPLEIGSAWYKVPSCTKIEEA